MHPRVLEMWTCAWGYELTLTVFTLHLPSPNICNIITTSQVWAALPSDYRDMFRILKWDRMKLLRCGYTWSPKLRAAPPIAQPICHKMFPLKKPQPKLYFGTRSVLYFWSVVHCNNAGGWWILYEPSRLPLKLSPWIVEQQATVTWSPSQGGGWTRDAPQLR